MDYIILKIKEKFQEIKFHGLKLNIIHYHFGLKQMNLPDIGEIFSDGVIMVIIVPPQPGYGVVEIITNIIIDKEQLDVVEVMFGLMEEMMV